MTAFAPDDARVRALADEILARQRYAAYRWAPDYLWLIRLLGWLRSEHPVGYALLIAGLSLLTVLLVWHMVVVIRRTAGGARRPAAAAPDLPRWDDEAARLAAAGRYLDAAHRLQLGTIDLLVRARVLDLSRYEANRVLRGRVARAPLPPAERTALVALLARFERAWFRDRRDDPALYAAWQDLHRRLALVVGGAA